MYRCIRSCRKDDNRVSSGTESFGRGPVGKLSLTLLVRSSGWGCRQQSQPGRCCS
jgi:hypothetical protein